MARRNGRKGVVVDGRPGDEACLLLLGVPGCEMGFTAAGWGAWVEAGALSHARSLARCRGEARDRRSWSCCG